MDTNPIVLSSFISGGKSCNDLPEGPGIGLFKTVMFQNKVKAFVLTNRL